MNMIEKVARAIWSATPNAEFSFDNLSEQHKKYLRKLAKAAIEAMREPSEGMLKPYVDAYCHDLDVAANWRCMIDAALKEE